MTDLPPDIKNQQHRQRALTVEDKRDLAAMLASELRSAEHPCRFANISPDDLAFFKDLVVIYKEGRSEMIKLFVKAVLYGVVTLVVLYAWVKYGGKP